jgi:transposase
MEISEAQYRRIEPILPRQRGNVSMSNLTVLNAILYVAEQGCKWRGLPGEASDAKAGRELRGGIGPWPAPLHLIMDRAYEDNETRQLALDFGFIPVVPPKSNRLEPWQYDKALYRKRHAIERLFRRLKGFRRIFSRFDQLDVVFVAFIHFALIVEALR